jgi:hypothetical protein
MAVCAEYARVRRFDRLVARQLCGIGFLAHDRAISLAELG